jgi:universal stress protein E
MSTIRRILVAVKDPWARPSSAVEKAAQLARSLGAQLQLFHALSQPLYIDAAEASGVTLATLERTAHDRAAKRLESLAARLQKTGIRAQAVTQWDYPPHEAVVRAAGRFRADLIVAERHPGAHHMAWLLRFTDFELLRLAPVPVLLVKTSGKYRRPAVLAAVDPSHAYSKPLGLDGEILRRAAQITAALKGSLHALYAFDPMPIPVTDAGLPLAATLDEIATDTEARARKALSRVLNGAAIPESRRHLVPRHPIDAIEEAAQETGCGIVVMGAISRSGLKRLAIGNTAERVFDELPCDLLVVKPRRFASRVPRARRGPQLLTLPVIEAGM